MEYNYKKLDDFVELLNKSIDIDGFFRACSGIFYDGAQGSKESNLRVSLSILYGSEEDNSSLIRIHCNRESCDDWQGFIDDSIDKVIEYALKHIIHSKENIPRNEHFASFQDIKKDFIDPVRKEKFKDYNIEIVNK